MDTHIKDLMRQVKMANSSWRLRVRHELQDYQYDQDADILYIAYGKPREAFSMPLDNSEDDIYLRIDPDTHEIVGIEIMNFREVFLDNHADAREVFDSFFGLFGYMDWRIQLRLPSVEGDGEVALLVPASRAPMEYFPNYIPGIAPDLVPA